MFMLIYTFLIHVIQLESGTYHGDSDLQLAIWMNEDELLSV